MSFVKDVIQKLLSPAGLRLQRFNPGQIIPEEIADKEYYVSPEDPNRMYRPWLSPDHTRLFTPDVVQNTMLSHRKLYFLYKMLRSSVHLPGDIFEAGSGSGGSGRLMLNCLNELGLKKRMWLLDTFEGYQKIDPKRDGSHMQINQCKCNGKEEVEQLLKDPRIETRIVKGLIPATLDEVKAEQICFAHIDVNLHEPTLAAADFCLSRMPQGAVMVFDDYGWPATYGARLAIDEVCRKHKQQVVSLQEQGFLIKV